MDVKPILFNTDMVRAILDGRKTQTRRLVKPQPVYNDGMWELGGAGWGDYHIPIHPVPGHSLWERQPVKPGDILWVRETWCRWWMPHGEWHYCYKASDPNGNKRPTGPEYDDGWETRPWSPSIHMPREAARLFLRVNEVRIERLQDISPLDVKAEGIEITCYEDEYDVEMSDEAMERLLFSVLWDKTIKPADSPRYGWFANPWVWVIEFERLGAKPAGLWADRDTAQ